MDSRGRKLMQLGKHGTAPPPFSKENLMDSKKKVTMSQNPSSHDNVRKKAVQEYTAVSSQIKTYGKTQVASASDCAYSRDDRKFVARKGNSCPQSEIGEMNTNTPKLSNLVNVNEPISSDSDGSNANIRPNDLSTSEVCDENVNPKDPFHVTYGQKSLSTIWTNNETTPNQKTLSSHSQEHDTPEKQEQLHPINCRMNAPSKEVFSCDVSKNDLQLSVKRKQLISSSLTVLSSSTASSPSGSLSKTTNSVNNSHVTNADVLPNAISNPEFCNEDIKPTGQNNTTSNKKVSIVIKLPCTKICNIKNLRSVTKAATPVDVETSQISSDMPEILFGEKSLFACENVTDFKTLNNQDEISRDEILHSPSLLDAENYENYNESESVTLCGEKSTLESENDTNSMILKNHDDVLSDVNAHSLSLLDPADSKKESKSLSRKSNNSPLSEIAEMNKNTPKFANLVYAPETICVGSEVNNTDNLLNALSTHEFCDKNISAVSTSEFSEENVNSIKSMHATDTHNRLSTNCKY